MQASPKPSLNSALGLHDRRSSTRRPPDGDGPRRAVAVLGSRCRMGLSSLVCCVAVLSCARSATSPRPAARTAPRRGAGAKPSPSSQPHAGPTSQPHAGPTSSRARGGVSKASDGKDRPSSSGRGRPAADAKPPRADAAPQTPAKPAADRAARPAPPFLPDVRHLPKRCRAIVGRARRVWAAGGRCETDSDCACYGSLARDNVLDVSDKRRATVLQRLSERYRARRCPTVHVAVAGPVPCTARCVAGRCRK